MLLLLACRPASQELILQDSNNYSFSSSITAESTPITEGEDAVIDWSGLGADMLGNSLALVCCSMCRD